MLNSKLFLSSRGAVVYVRVYNKESTNKYSLDEQESVITKYSKDNGFNILKVFREENASAKNFDRKAFSEMMHYINLNKFLVKFVVVIDLSRISTNPNGLKRLKRYLKENRIKLISIVQSLIRYSEKQAKQAH